MARRGARSGWKPIAFYGAVLAAGTLALDWLDYRRMARLHADHIYVFLVAAAFLAIGVFVGARALGAPQPLPFDGNARAQAALGISARELAVLQALAAGCSNQEIAAELHVSLNTVKTHVARLLDKLGARRRTDAIARARELGLLP